MPLVADRKDKFLKIGHPQSMLGAGRGSETESPFVAYVSVQAPHSARRSAKGVVSSNLTRRNQVREQIGRVWATTKGNLRFAAVCAVPGWVDNDHDGFVIFLGILGDLRDITQEHPASRLLRIRSFKVAQGKLTVILRSLHLLHFEPSFGVVPEPPATSTTRNAHTAHKAHRETRVGPCRF